uniref:PPM-type phosphatase domain-containing protein n=1 Tax=Macrostomum lignano TaxID=282301 RepID=A0A1I8GCG8_9PLAT
MCSISQSVSEQIFDHPVVICGSYRGQERAAETVWFGSSPEDVPALPLAALDSSVFAACTGPDDGLADASLAIYDRKPSLAGNGLQSTKVPGSIATDAEFWRQTSRKAFGSATSLYDTSPVTKRVSGDPIADCFGLVARGNSAVLAVADGVNWGEKSRLAARAAVRAGLMHANSYAALPDALPDTRKSLSVLLESFTAAHSAILRAQGGLTTLCIAAALPLARPPQFAVCCVNLGDTFAYVWSKSRGLRELTVGSHDV